MAVEADIYTELTTDATVSGLVGTNVFPSVAPQDADLPHVVYQRIGGGPIDTSPGPSGTTNRLYAFYCRATSYSGMKTLAEAVRDVLGTYTAAAGSPSVSSCRLIEESEDVEYWPDDAETPVHVTTQTYSLWHGSS